MLVAQTFQLDRTHLSSYPDFMRAVEAYNVKAALDGREDRQPSITEGEYEESLRHFIPEAVPGQPGCYYSGYGGWTSGGGRGCPQSGKTIPPIWAKPDLSDLFTDDGDIVIEYGICDSVEQFLKVYGDKLRACSKKFVVLFRECPKEDNGMRWHKHGPYIGKQKVEGFEYIKDEPHVGTVWTYEIAEVVPESEPMTPDFNEGFNLWLQKRHAQARAEASPS